MFLAIFAGIVAFVIAITVHEASHAWMADRLGDPTAKLMGRLSLNPIVHYDPVGTTMLLVLVIMRAIGIPVIPFGWAKPVEFDPYNLQNPRRDSALISFAGPISNLILALLTGLVVRLIGVNSLIFAFAYPLITLNVVLAIFNLIPIHPLDGGKIFIGLLPENEAEEAEMFLRRYGIFLLFVLIFPTFGGVSPVSMIISPIVNFIIEIILPSSQLI